MAGYGHSGKLSLCTKTQTKNGSDHATSEPLFILDFLFYLFLAHLLTLLLIGERRLRRHTFDFMAEAGMDSFYIHPSQ
jgi:hypothetical protein